MHLVRSLFRYTQLAGGVREPVLTRVVSSTSRFRSAGEVSYTACAAPFIIGKLARGSGGGSTCLKTRDERVCKRGTRVCRQTRCLHVALTQPGTFHGRDHEPTHVCPGTNEGKGALSFVNMRLYQPRAMAWQRLVRTSGSCRCIHLYRRARRSERGGVVVRSIVRGARRLAGLGGGAYGLCSTFGVGQRDTCVERAAVHLEGGGGGPAEHPFTSHHL